ncbi:MAG: FliI/YscN family ATPase [Planctomycetes bacterium]|nr:FliI/YscN family ATPase [Planctomycetota bacterium]
MTHMQPSLDDRLKRLRDTRTLLSTGRVAQVIGLTIEGQGPSAALGELCQVHLDARTTRPAVVVGFREDRVLLMPLGELEGICPGMEISASGRPLSIQLTPRLRGRVVDGLGQPLDELGRLGTGEMRSLAANPPDPLRRPRVKDVIPLGVRAVDGLMTCGRGQRIGIFGGSGVGKSTLLGMFARYAKADLNVIALIGERGREVRDFIERDLGPEGLARSVVVVVTSDQPALMRVKGALTAATIAEYFRDQGLDVLLMMDSVTRFCTAQREIGLAVGEPPTTRGYTPSVFALLPKLLERSGNSERGSITGLYTVLVEGDDMNEPVADAVRSILDGHIVLSRTLAGANHYPAIDVLHSQSRTFGDITTPEHRAAAANVRDLMAVHEQVRDLVQVGAYVKGSNPKADLALSIWPKIQGLLRQDANDLTSFDQVVARMRELPKAP